MAFIADPCELRRRLRAQHLIIFDETSGSGTRDTVHGPACGLSWPISAQFRQDMEELADLWVGDGPLYVTMFSEFQTYPCQRNQWDGAENYYAALKDNFRAGAATFRRVAEERDSEVSVSFGPWGGWQHQWDEPSVGAGRSLFGHFDDAMRQSDFQSFQVMGNEPGRNADTTLAMLRTLSPYGPVMLAHYKPDNRSGACKGRVSPRDGMAATGPKNPCGATRPHRWSHGRWTDSPDRPPVTLYRDRWAPGRAPVRAFLHAGATFSSGGRNERLPGGDPSPSPLTTGPVRPGRSST